MVGMRDGGVEDVEICRDGMEGEGVDGGEGWREGGGD